MQVVPDKTALPVLSNSHAVVCTLVPSVCRLLLQFLSVALGQTTLLWAGPSLIN